MPYNPSQGEQPANHTGSPDSRASASEDDASQSVESTGVTLSALTKRFDDVVAVDSIDLEVNPGELLVLLGPSGCGKTTTLRMIAGLEAISDGVVEIGGDDVTRTTPQERDVAMVFQSYALYPHKTVRENIEFPLEKLSLTDDEMAERVTETASLLDIDDLLGKQPSALSGGQRQRVAVGRALARQPSVLLMDEPLSNLDAKLAVTTRSELRDLQQRLGITTVYVTHDQEEAMSIADRIAVMNQGRIEQIGSPREVYQEPRSEFIATFLGDPSMNVFDADGPATPLRRTLTETAPTATARVGIRPEDGYLLGDDGPIGTPATAVTEAVKCTVTVVEPIGRAYEITVRAGDQQFVIRTRTRPEWLEPDADVQVVFGQSEITFFDETGRRIDDG